jgi:hypothetical protein
MKSAAAAMIPAASLSVPATANADCGDPGQDPCTGPVPTVDQVVAIMAKLTDPSIPAANKSDIVTTCTMQAEEHRRSRPSIAT